jgi:hypothetical protein
MNSAEVRLHNGSAHGVRGERHVDQQRARLALRGQLRELATTAGQVPDWSTLVIPSVG